MTVEIPTVIFHDTRYSRQEEVPLLAKSGQQRLSKSSVAVVGAGGVKSTLLLHLAASGVGRIRIIDFDTIELSNLNRQILYTTSDIGRFKAEAAAERLRSLNPEIEIESIVDRVTSSNFLELLAGFDLVFEGGDSAEARLSFNAEACRHGITYVHASAQYNYAYVFTVVPGLTPCFDCVFSDLPRSHGGPVPVIGSATAMAGSIATCEAISILCGRGPQLTNRLLLHDGWLNESFSIPLYPRCECAICNTKKA